MTNEINLGPRALLTTDNDYLISHDSWIKLQLYIQSATLLPTTEESLKQRLPAEPPGGMDQFNELIEAYVRLNKHCIYWRDNVFEESVSCASDVVNYGNMAPIYFKPLIELLPKLEQKDSEAIEKFKAILEVAPRYSLWVAS